MALDAGNNDTEHRVLIIPPTRRDGDVTLDLLCRANVQCEVCNDIAGLIGQLPAGVGTIVLTERSLADPGLPALLQMLDRQPTWSDLPVLLLTRERDSRPATSGVLSRLSNLTVLDRPVSTRSMLSAVLAALRARRRQYQIRDQLIDQRRAEQALLDADRRKDEFLATLAHELRNPLAPIRTGLDLLGLVQPHDPQSERLRQMMGRQLAQLVKLIDDLLDVSRISTGKVVIQRERVDLRRVIETALEGAQPVIDAAQHRVTVQQPSHPVWVVGDPTRLAQVVGNLLTNAAKYTPNGGKITVALEELPGEAVLRVSDNGAGIPSHLLEQVFDIFAQVNRTLDRAQGGLGIGLSLVRRLMELHGGTVHAESAGLDRGSTFCARLPAVTPEPAAPGAERGAGVDERPASRRLRVLVVDDNIDAADVLASRLKSSGHVTRTEYGGASALQAAREFQPEVVLCDIGMPGMDGHEVARRLRADRANVASVLVALTGWGSDEDKRRTRLSGFDFHLVKPVGSDALDDILDRL